MRLGSPLLSASALLLGLTTGLTTGACGADLDVPEVIWSGQHLDYATDPERAQPLCAGTFHLQDRFVRALADYLGIPLRDRDRILYAYVDHETLQDLCPLPIPVLGCARYDTAVSSLPYHRHELVHALSLTGRWHGPPAFEEGLAEAFSDAYDYGGDRIPIAQVLHNFDYSADNMRTVGLFVRFLLDRHGVERVAGFMKAAQPDDAPTENAGVFAALFGETLEAASAAFEASPTCSISRNPIPLLECAHAEPWDGHQLTLRVEVLCSSPEVQGPTIDGWGTISTSRAFDVPEAGVYRFKGSGERVMPFSLSRCGSCSDSMEPIAMTAGFELAYDLSLDPGRYYITFSGSDRREATVDLEISRLR